ncbi:enoyl-CoA hydratase/isomerase family protein [Mesorhizobium sp. ANAO-SY3R2]|uniref:enoyl-CoA hydratase/isomerase family protein n=1 Tax=Mesorhizobium sp. ANAO-SY3R2 TaxID=3166644 RepID=UPI00366E9528
MNLLLNDQENAIAGLPALLQCNESEICELNRSKGRASDHSMQRARGARRIRGRVTEFATPLRSIPPETRVGSTLDLPHAGRRRTPLSVICTKPAENVGLITINRPSKRNSLDAASENALREAWDWADRDASIRCIVLTGAGDKAFCAGADIGEFLPELQRRVEAGEDEGNFGGLARQYPTEKPIIAAINGVAWGGGLELALACDIRLASANASFALPEVRWGIIAGAGGATRLPRLLPAAVAAEMLLAGLPIDAESARLHGLVSRLFSDHGSLMQGALELATRIASNAPLAVAQTLSLIRNSRGVLQGESLDMERAAFRRILTTRDASEGMAAFNENRTPVYKGE